MTDPKRLAARLGSLLDRFDGPPIALPEPVDRACEWFAQRTPRSRAGMALGLALVITLVLGGRVAADPLGARQPVLVANRDLPPGAPVGPDDLRVVEWPSALAGDALPVDAWPERIAWGIPKGAVVRSSHAAGDSPADVAGPGRAVMTVPHELAPGLVVGDVVDLHGREGLRVSAAVVLGQTAEGWLVEVSRDEASTLASALSWGELFVAVLGQ